MANTKVQRALLSVSDKTGVVEFAAALARHGVELLSTGGTALALRGAGLAVIDVAEFTGSPEVMDGRVKTLHPRVHGGILMRDSAGDREELQRLGGQPIDLVCVNLYPFAATVARGAPRHEVIENIDIGGPSMLRSAAKNHERVVVLSDPADYDELLGKLATGIDAALRWRLAAKAFAHTAAYDSAIASYFAAQKEEADGVDGDAAHLFPQRLQFELRKVYDLRYGENPHQRGAFYAEPQAPVGSLAAARSVDEGGKELSFNNLVDVDAAVEAVREFSGPVAVVVKHANPSGVATDASLEHALRRARAADELSAFGGIVALNRPVDVATAAALAETFLECVAAPEFEPEALALLRGKKNLRLLALGNAAASDKTARQFKRVSGGFVVQDIDSTGPGEVAQGRLVTRRSPSADELQQLDFAWRVCKHVKSNAIVLARHGATVGIGAGQMSRVVSVQIAVEKAGLAARDSVLASDAFFPFADGLEAAAKAGVRAVVQPGGSKRDDEVIAAADRADIAMVFTGVRHFRH